MPTSHHLSLLFALYFWSILFPIMNGANLERCTSIGILERDQDKCVTIIPRGKANDFPSPKIKAEQCNKYLANEDKYREEYVTWENVQNFDAPINVYFCRKNGDCTVAKMYKYSDIFTNCTNKGFKGWIWFRRASINTAFSLSECENKVAERKRYFLAGWNESREISDQFEIPEMIQGSLFYSILGEDPFSKVFFFETSNMTSDGKPGILAFTRYSEVTRISTKNTISIESGRSIPCSRSNQCDNLVFLSCQDKRRESNYIFSVSIDSLSSDMKETNLNLDHESSFLAKFDTEIVGINVFMIEYPKNLISFLMKASGSWYLTVFEKVERKLDKRCSSPKLKSGFPIFCKLPEVPSGHSLRYFSITNANLMMHTAYQNSIRDHVVETCYLMNDCFGCILISTHAPYTCKWDENVCISSSSSSSEKVDDCIQIEGLRILPERRGYFLLIKILGVHLTNNFMGSRIQPSNGEPILPQETLDGEVKFAIKTRDRNKVEELIKTTTLIIRNSKFSIEVEVALKKDNKPPSSSGATNPVVILIIILITLVILFSIFFTYKLCYKRIPIDRDFELMQKTIPSEMERPEVKSQTDIGSRVKKKKSSTGRNWNEDVEISEKKLEAQID